MKKLNILMIGTADNQGGAAKMSWTLGHELRKRGHKVSWLVRTKRSNKNYVQALQNEMQTLLGHLRTLILSDDISFGHGTDILSHPWYKRADLVHLHNLHGSYFQLKTLIQMSHDKPLVWSLHDMWAITGKYPYILTNYVHKITSQYPPMLFNKVALLKKAKAKIYHAMKRISVIPSSQWLLRLTKKSGLNRHHLSQIYNGIDTSLFRPAKMSVVRKKLGMDPKKSIYLLVVSGGMNNPFKGGRLIRAVENYFQAHQELELYLIGGKENKNEGNLHYLANLPHKKLLQYYQAANAVIVPSQADNNPLVVLEALASGKPIIATQVGGIPELITHQQNGYLAKPNKADLVKGLSWFEKLRVNEVNAIAKRNRAKAVKKYSVSTMADQFEKLYQSLV